MAILVEKALEHVVHELGRELTSKIDPMWVVNVAGRELDSMRQWTWQRRPTAALSLVAGSSSVDLPSDFGSLVQLWSTDETTSHARFVSQDELVFRKATQSNYTDSLVRYLALAPRRNTAAGGGPPIWSLDVFNTPNTTVQNALVLLYRACWTPVTKANDTLPIDESCDLLYVEILRAIAQGLQNSREGALAKRLALVRAGGTYQDAAAIDIRRIPDTPRFSMRGAVPIWPVPRLSGG